MGVLKKITVDVDSEVLKTAQSTTGGSISETVRQGLLLVAASKAFDRALSLRGQVKFSKSWKELKYDR